MRIVPVSYTHLDVYKRQGEHWGPPFHDGDMYKWMEGVASVYAVNKDPELLWDTQLFGSLRLTDFFCELDCLYFVFVVILPVFCHFCSLLILLIIY